MDETTLIFIVLAIQAGRTDRDILSNMLQDNPQAAPILSTIRADYEQMKKHAGVYDGR